MKTAVHIYEYFAEQVLTAEREQSAIWMTTRKTDTLFGSKHLSEDQGDIQALGFVLKLLLAGLPGGILGSLHLYRALVDIFYRDFSESEFKGTKSYLSGVAPAASAKIYIITLAILAFADEMQLELICAIFGFCAMLACERHRALEMRRKNGYTALGPFAGRLSIDRLSRAFAPLLTDSEQNAHWRPSEGARDDEHRKVTRILLENWQDISRMMRVFGSYGYPPRRSAIPWMSCGEICCEDGKLQDGKMDLPN